MKSIDKLERSLGSLAIPRLTLLLVVGQVVCFGLGLLKPEMIDRLLLHPKLVIEGEAWRLVTFLFLPPTSHPLILFFALYVFYLMGSALETEWGDFKFNMYILVGYIATVTACFILSVPATNVFLGATVFFAFAGLYPDFELRLFFLLPVKVKYLAIISWIGYALALVLGTWPVRICALASISNFVLFFGRNIVGRVAGVRRRIEIESKSSMFRKSSFHTCALCGVTDTMDPRMEFRVCSKCGGGRVYCSEHINDHAHVTED